MKKTNRIAGELDENNAAMLVILIESQLQLNALTDALHDAVKTHEKMLTEINYLSCFTRELLSMAALVVDNANQQLSHPIEGQSEESAQAWQSEYGVEGMASPPQFSGMSINIVKKISEMVRNVNNTILANIIIAEQLMERDANMLLQSDEVIRSIMEKLKRTESAGETKSPMPQYQTLMSCDKGLFSVDGHCKKSGI